MRVYQFRQFRIGHDLLLLRMFANMSSVLGNLFFVWAASNKGTLRNTLAMLGIWTLPKSDIYNEPRRREAHEDRKYQRFSRLI
jgi:hypothetical protein